MAALLPTWDVAANQVLGHYVEADPETEVIRPRYTQLIPACYAALLVRRKPIRPKQAYKELVSAITLRAGGTRNLLREHHPPTNDTGAEFCVAWWTRGGCFPNCGRRATHTAFASPDERARLLAYVRTHLQAPAAASHA